MRQAKNKTKQKKAERGATHKQTKNTYLSLVWCHQRHAPQRKDDETALYPFQLARLFVCLIVRQQIEVDVNRTQRIVHLGIILIKAQNVEILIGMALIQVQDKHFIPAGEQGLNLEAEITRRSK